MKRLFKSIHTAGAKATCSHVKRRISGDNLLFTAKFASSTSDKTYRAVIASTVNTSTKGMKVTDEYDDVVTVKRPGESTKFSVRCDCPEYQFTYAFPNKAHKVHYGKLPVVPKKTKGSTRPPRNPDAKIGSCKHIQALYKQSLTKGWIRKST